ncbi:cytochrome c oxidase subunit II [Pacificimonas flava]|uniref:Cytochrome aa3 subunit 2 n=1 Tax=Pacificimonas flava TaxID=1234595 RepID=M2SGH5_9SPHN|nr:cytochrome c oxidase subunit II [Pacificimonas flava]EMD84465.1 Cytochrome c oxidase polypeptide II [Pacificimonas flava]MBB5279663.1 cytochrome c oxidase subunit 2 [Pacificimonas flava]
MLELPPILDPAGPQAAPVTALSWILFVGGAVITLLIVGLMIVAVVGTDRLKAALAGERMILIGGLGFTIVSLLVLLIAGLGMTASLASRSGEEMLTVRVTGLRWWWRLEYPGFEAANELVIPAGQPVRIELRSADVLHSFWVPQLAGKRDMIPGKDNSLIIEADRPGVYAGYCTEFCGAGHALMQFRTIALPPDEYALWAAAQARPAALPADDLSQRGQRLFDRIGCGSCHNVAGTRAAGRTGPDLTHIGSRTMLGAGILPNNRGTLAGWTADPAASKPGVLMPGYTYLSAGELQALAAYMDGLE